MKDVSGSSTGRPTAWLIPGFNVWDGGADTILKAKQALELHGFQTRVHDYGWTNLVDVRIETHEAAESLLKKVGPNDIMLGHSNGSAVIWWAIEKGVRCRAAVCIQPALQRNTIWDAGRVEHVLYTYNRRDWAVVASRWWRYINPVSWINPHYWGEAGHAGFTHKQPFVEGWNTLDKRHEQPVGGHSTIFEDPYRRYWMPKLARWARKAVPPNPSV